MRAKTPPRPAGALTASRTRIQGDHVTDQLADKATGLDPRIGAAVVDVLVYVVVLNLFVEYFPGVLSESFTLSLLTAVLLKVILDIVVAAKNRTKARFAAASTPSGKVAAAVLLWVVLILSLLLSRVGVQHLLKKPGA